MALYTCVCVLSSPRDHLNSFSVEKMVFMMIQRAKVSAINEQKTHLNVFIHCFPLSFILNTFFFSHTIPIWSDAQQILFGKTNIFIYFSFFLMLLCYVFVRDHMKILSSNVLRAHFFRASTKQSFHKCFNWRVLY